MEYLISAILCAISGFIGYQVRQYREPVLPSIVLPPNAAEGTYEVRHNGRLVYRGDDLDKAKQEFKYDSFPRGTVELYNRGNHVASRRVQ